MSFTFVTLDSLNFDLNSETTESGRFYTTPTGVRYPSVTTVLSKDTKEGLQKWIDRIGVEEANKIKNRAGNRGTKLHSLCEEYLKGELSKMKMSRLMPFDKMLFQQLYPLLDKHVNNVYCLEQALFSHKYKLAGRVDLIAEWDGEIAVIDFKSSTKEKKEEYILNYFLQCTAYSEMFEEITGKEITKIVVAIATEEQSPQVFIKTKYNYLSELQKVVDNYWKV